jgi:thymidylate synthase ThyX
MKNLSHSLFMSDLSDTLSTIEQFITEDNDSYQVSMHDKQQERARLWLADDAETLFNWQVLKMGDQNQHLFGKVVQVHQGEQ